jgi:hypothetical protein
VAEQLVKRENDSLSRSNIPKYQSSAHYFATSMNTICLAMTIKTRVRKIANEVGDKPTYIPSDFNGVTNLENIRDMIVGMAMHNRDKERDLLLVYFIEQDTVGRHIYQYTVNEEKRDFLLDLPDIIVHYKTNPLDEKVTTFIEKNKKQFIEHYKEKWEKGCLVKQEDGSLLNDFLQYSLLFLHYSRL